jgi:hypothetical protein
MAYKILGELNKTESDRIQLNPMSGLTLCGPAI